MRVTATEMMIDVELEMIDVEFNTLVMCCSSMRMMMRSYGQYSDPLVTYGLDASNELSYLVDEYELRLVWFQITAKQRFGQCREDRM